jgi:TonB family protein
MQQIGRYQLVGELGRGGMGVVYDAIDPIIGRRVAIKVISLQALAGMGAPGDLRESLFREARSSGGLNHPGIVTVFDVGNESDIAYIAMELVEGPTLQKLLSSGPKPSRAEMLDVLRQTALALDYAHENGVIHRDIKPANIMLQKDRIAKIGDFGIAKTIGTTHHTQTGLLMGTPSYMSPEQMRGEPATARSDQFSLAVVAFEMLSGVKPFQADSLAVLVHKIVYEPRPAPSSMNPSLPPELDYIFRRALSQNPEDRYANCAELSAEVEGALREKPVPETPVAIAPRENVPVRRPASAVSPAAQPAASPRAPVAPLRPPVPRPPSSEKRTPRAPPRAGLSSISGRKPSVLTGLSIVGGAVALLAVGVVVYMDLGPGSPPRRNLADRKTAQSPEVPPLTAQINAEPPSIARGGSANVRWAVTGADKVVIDPGIGEVAANGSREVTPDSSTTYVLTATGAGGKTSATAALNVIRPPSGASKPGSKGVLPAIPKSDLAIPAPPTVLEFRTEPGTVRRGGEFRLYWNVAGATGISIDPVVGSVVASGVKALTASATTRFTLRALGKGGSVSQSATIVVAEPAKAVIGAFTAVPREIAPGGTAVLRWTVESAHDVTLDGAAVNAQDSRTVQPATTTIYTLKATGSGGADQRTVSVSVTAPRTPPASSTRSQPNAPKRVKILGTTMETYLLRKVPPVYPPAAKDAGVSGVVRLKVLVDISGRVTAAQPLQGNPLLLDEAMMAARRYLYRPQTRRGQPVEVETEIDIGFSGSRKR